MMNASIRTMAPITPAQAQRRWRLSEAGITPKNLRAFVQDQFGEHLHAKTAQSVAMAALGVLHAVSLGVHDMGRGLAAALGLVSKHATKQVDRLLSNGKVHMWVLFEAWVRYVVGPRKEIIVAMDWTEFDADDQATICIYMVTRHGRATPLVWRSAYKSTMEGRRNGYEDEVLECLKAALSDDVKVTVLADRGFGDQKRYEHLSRLGFDYVIRFVTHRWLTSLTGMVPRGSFGRLGECLWAAAPRLGLAHVVVDTLADHARRQLVEVSIELF